MEINVTKENFEDIVIKGKGLIVVDFYATWCGPCMMLSPIFEELDNKYNGKIVIAKINVDMEEDLAREFKINAIPDVFFYKDGIIVDSFLGYKSKDEIEKIIDRNL